MGRGSGPFTKVCKRCGGTWGAWSDNPKRCALCATPYWNEEKSKCTHCDFVWSKRFRNKKEPNKCPKCRRNLHKPIIPKIERECLKCSYLWMSKITSKNKTCPRCQRLPQTEDFFRFPIFEIYKNCLDLIWPQLGLTEMAYRMVKNYLCFFCYTSVGKKVERSSQRVCQVILKTEKKLYKPKALIKLREALLILGKIREAEQIDKYIQCRKSFLHITA